MLRKSGLAVAVAAMLVALPGPSRAADLPLKTPTLKGPLSSSIFGTGAGGAGFLTFAAGAIIGVAAGMCAYDIYLKIEGVKNWDGSPNVAKSHKHHRAA